MNGERADEMTVFVRAVELGGFSAAARALGLTPSAVSKSISRLEDRLGVRLLNRTTRSLTTTPEGETFLERSRRILADIEEAEQEITRFDREPDFAEEGIDLAVRSGDVADESLIARRICLMERVICAAPSYLKRHGVPRTPDDLLQHNCILVSTHPPVWPFDAPDGPRGIRVRGNVTANNAETAVQLAILGLGVVRLGDLLVGDPLRRKQLVPLLTHAHHVEPVPIHAMYLPGRHRSPKVAAMVDFLIENFGHAPWRLPVARPAPRSRAAIA